MRRSQKEILVLLNSIPTCNARKVRALCEVFGDVREVVQPQNRMVMEKVEALGEGFVAQLTKRLKNFDPEKEIIRAEKESVTLISYRDEGYPQALHEIYDPPVCLYVKGHLSWAQTSCISMVGSRYASMYGRHMAEQLAYDFAVHDIPVVSGLAKGIDSASHRGALKAAGITVAVLGCGIDIVYPRENKKLYERIVEKGAVISEYPFGIQPHPYNFPKRNRLISGISCGTIVVEAAKRSGSLITARCALDEGREVYSIPGPVSSLSSSGTNNLIKQGATLIISAQDVIRELFPDKMLCEKKVTRHDRQQPVRCESTSAQEIIRSLGRKPVSLDTILETVALSPGEVHKTLIELESNRHITRLMGEGYILN